MRVRRTLRTYGTPPKLVDVALGSERVRNGRPSAYSVRKRQARAAPARNLPRGHPSAYKQECLPHASRNVHRGQRKMRPSCRTQAVVCAPKGRGHLSPKTALLLSKWTLLKPRSGSHTGTGLSVQRSGGREN